jgi:hypothetical protein
MKSHPTQASVYNDRKDWFSTLYGIVHDRENNHNFHYNKSSILWGEHPSAGWLVTLITGWVGFYYTPYEKTLFMHIQGGGGGQKTSLDSGGQ